MKREKQWKQCFSEEKKLVQSKDSIEFFYTLKTFFFYKQGNEKSKREIFPDASAYNSSNVARNMHRDTLMG